MARFLDKAPRVREGGKGLDPVRLPMSAEARKILVSFHDEVEGQNAPGGALAMIKGFAGKMPEHAGRLAAVLAVYADPDAIEIDAGSMAHGIAPTRFYAAEMIRLSDGARVVPDLKLARQLADWWKARSDNKCHLLEVYQYGPNPLREAATAKRIMGILEEHGWVERLPPGTVLDGKPRRDSWELVP
jgi:hypothetical protein